MLRNNREDYIPVVMKRHVEVGKKPKILEILLSYANSKYQTFRVIKVVTWTNRLRHNAGLLHQLKISCTANDLFGHN